MLHDLPHGATIDLETQILRLPVGEKIVLKFHIKDFYSFCDVMDDLKMIMDFHTSILEYHCGTCGGVEDEVTYKPPEDEHEN